DILCSAAVGKPWPHRLATLRATTRVGSRVSRSPGLLVRMVLCRVSIRSTPKLARSFASSSASEVRTWNSICRRSSSYRYLRRQFLKDLPFGLNREQQGSEPTDKRDCCERREHILDTEVADDPADQQWTNR